MSGLLEHVVAWRKRRRERNAEKRVKGPKDHWLREALETIATAVIMALVVRHFAIEAFKIPTESMSPTLYGDAHGGGAGDRILVNKFPLYFRDPERWSIIVFRFPLDLSQNYVKRLVGLPGETLELLDGDAWVDGRIERKPTEVQEKVWREVAPGKIPAIRVRQPWIGENRKPWRTAGGERRVDGSQRRRRFRLWAPVDDRTVDRPEPTMMVGDLRVRGEVEIEDDGGTVTLRIVEHDRTYEAVLTAGGGIVVRMEGEEHEVGEASIERGEGYEFAFVNVDDSVEFHLDGDRLFRREYETDGRPGESRVANSVEIEVNGGRVRFDDLAVDRDIAYSVIDDSCATRIRIPPDRYVMLGDNSSNSHDGRRWREGLFVMKDGRTYRFEQHKQSRSHPGAPRPQGDHILFVDVTGLPRDILISDLAEPARVDGNGRVIRLADGREFETLIGRIRFESDRIEFTDLSGVERVVAVEDLAVPDTTKLDHTPFVTREQIVGEAFFVFWPILPPAGFRIRLL